MCDGIVTFAVITKRDYFVCSYLCTSHLYPLSLGAGNTRNIAELKCGDLTYDVSPQCRGFAEV